MLRLGVRYGSDESVALIDRVYELIAATATRLPAIWLPRKAASPSLTRSPSWLRLHAADARGSARNRAAARHAQCHPADASPYGNDRHHGQYFYWRRALLQLGLLPQESAGLARGTSAHRSAVARKHPDAEDLPDYFVTAMDLSPAEHVKVQGAFQRWIDSAISKTCNVPNDYTVEQVGELYQYMYELGCKGGTIYRDGSRDEQVLMLKGDERAEDEMAGLKAATGAEPATTPHHVYPRPDRLTGTTVATQTPFGKPISPSTATRMTIPLRSSWPSAKLAQISPRTPRGLGRMLSLLLRSTAPHNRREMMKLIIEQLQDIGGARPIGFGPSASCRCRMRWRACCKWNSSPKTSHCSWACPSRRQLARKRRLTMPR